MSLDVLLYRFKDIDGDIKDYYTQRELYECGLDYVTVDNKEALPKELRDRFARRTKVELWRWDYSAIYKVFQKTYPEFYSEDASKVDISNFKPENIRAKHFGKESSYLFVDFGLLMNDKKGDYHHPHVELTFSKKSDEDAFIVTVAKPAYVYKVEDLIYQRKRLNSNHRLPLPESRTYVTDKKQVEELVESYGLDKGFIDKWVDGETAFWCRYKTSEGGYRLIKTKQ